MEQLEPKCQKSKTDIALPRRAVPYIEKLDPILTKDLKDKEEPKVKKSKRDIDEPAFIIP
jgi:hypothetical protein